jgi:hypothetical protein
VDEDDDEDEPRRDESLVFLASRMSMNEDTTSSERMRTVLVALFGASILAGVSFQNLSFPRSEKKEIQIY